VRVGSYSNRKGSFKGRRGGGQHHLRLNSPGSAKALLSFQGKKRVRSRNQKGSGLRKLKTTAGKLTMRSIEAGPIEKDSRPSGSEGRKIWAGGRFLNREEFKASRKVGPGVNSVARLHRTLDDGEGLHRARIANHPL